MIDAPNGITVDMDRNITAAEPVISIPLASGVVAALEKQIINRAGKDGQPLRRRDGNQHGKTDGKACLGDNRPFFSFWQPPGK